MVVQWSAHKHVYTPPPPQKHTHRGGTIGEGLKLFDRPGAPLTRGSSRTALQMGSLATSGKGSRLGTGPPHHDTLGTGRRGGEASSGGGITTSGAGGGLFRNLRGMLGGGGGKQVTPEHSTPSAAAAVLASMRNKPGSTSERAPLMGGSSSSTAPGPARRGGSLDAIFARLDGRGGSGGMGRIDDDDDAF